MARLSLGKVSKVTLADAQATARAHFALVASKVNPSTERAKAVAKVNDTLADRIDGFRDYLRDKKERSAGHIHEVERGPCVVISWRCIASIPPTSTGLW
jgi:hypothetical protein